MNASRQLAWSVAVFACNEAKRVRRSLQQFPADVAGHAIQVSVFANGCTDRTESVVEEFARSQPHISLHASQIADKANAWNLYIHEKAPPAKVHFFTDANKTIQPGSLQRLAKMLELNTGANAAASVPMNGRSRRTWRASIVNGQRVAGGLYALRGEFVRRLREAKARLPIGVLCNDATITLLAVNNLDERWALFGPAIVHDESAGFYFHSLSPFCRRDWQTWWKRKLRIQLKRYQQQLIEAHVRQHGVCAFPHCIDEFYRDEPVKPETGLFGRNILFHLLAVRHMRKRMNVLRTVSNAARR